MCAATSSERGKTRGHSGQNSSQPMSGEIKAAAVSLKSRAVSKTGESFSNSYIVRSAQSAVGLYIFCSRLHKNGLWRTKGYLLQRHLPSTGLFRRLDVCRGVYSNCGNKFKALSRKMRFRRF